MLGFGHRFFFGFRSDLTAEFRGLVRAKAAFVAGMAMFWPDCRLNATAFHALEQQLRLIARCAAARCQRIRVTLVERPLGATSRNEPKAPGLMATRSPALTRAPEFVWISVHT